MTTVKKAANFLVVLGAMSLAAGCVIEPTNADDPTEAESDWTEGLTVEEVIGAMPISVDYVQPEASAAEVDNGIGQRSLAATDVAVETEVKVEWELPSEFVSELLKSMDSIPWNVSMKVGDGAWEELDIDVDYTLDEERNVYRYFYLFRFFKVEFAQKLVTFKVDMADHNPAPYTETNSNIVSFFVFSDSLKDDITKTTSLRITILPETDAVAPSTLAMEFGGPFQLFNGIHELDLPATVEVDGTELSPGLPAFTMVRFIMTTDFSDPKWGFEGVTTVERGSNTSYCKVTMEEETDEYWRLKYSFEDLPITEITTEPNHKFDYNDLVFYLDIAKAPN